ncbi:MAG: CHAT domain-containing protein, partial [Bacteroidota bacterium]
GQAAGIYTNLAEQAAGSEEWARSAQRYYQAAECWYYENPDDMYSSLYMADSMYAFREAAPDTLAANIANSWGKLYYQYGYPDEARQYYQSALKLRLSLLPASHAAIMGSYNNLALVAYFYDDDYQQALGYYRKALAIAAQNPKVPQDWQARLYGNLARTYNVLDMPDSADLALHQALLFYKADGARATHPALIDLQLEICQSRIGRADFAEAEQMLQAYAQSLDDPALPLATRKKLPRVLELQGDLYKARRDWQRAQDTYLQAQEAYQTYPADNPLEAIRLPLRLAELALLRNELTRSEKIYQQLLQDSLALDQASAQSIYLNLAQLYQLMDRPEAIRTVLGELPQPDRLNAFDLSRYHLMQARLLSGTSSSPLYLKAIKQMKRAFKAHPSLSKLYWEYGRWQEAQGRADSARYYFQLALRSNQNQVGEVLSLPQQVYNLGSLASLERRSSPDIALQYYLRADSLLSLLGRIYPAEESRAILRDELSDFYTEAIGLLFADERVLRDAQRLELAFQLAEKSRANLLRERQQELSLLAQGIAPDLQDSLLVAQQILSHLRNQYFEADSLEQLSLRTRMAKQQSRCLQWSERLAEAHPNYYAWKYESEVPTLASLGETLGEGEYLLDYFWGEEEFFVFFVASGERFARRIAFGADEQAALQDLLALLVSVDAYYEDGEEVQARFAERSHYLYQTLLAPLLADHAPAQKLWIIPHRGLSYLPFEVLLTSPAQVGDDFRSFVYLLRQCPVRYGFLSTQPNHKYENPLTYAGFAPIYQTEGKELGVLRSSPLQNLAWARREVIQGQAIMGGEAYLDEAATEQQLLGMSEWPAVLHFSMHAILDDQEPLRSRLAFSPTEAHGDLMVHEIYQLPIQSQLAVLSACNTGQ